MQALAICGHQNRAVMRRRVDRTPGWWMECSDWKTASLYSMGTSGRNTPVERSPSGEASLTACVVICSVLEFISGPDRCAAAIAAKSTACTSAMATRIGRSGAARPSYGQSSAVGAEEVGCAVVGCWAGFGGGLLTACNDVEVESKKLSLFLLNNFMYFL
jgi:hypothetical protein